MTGYKYGEFSDQQIATQKKSLHSALFWLLLYKDPDTRSKYTYVNVDHYMDSLLCRLGGMNELFGYPPDYVRLMSTLQAARDELNSDEFNWGRYRKLVLDAHAIIDKFPD